MKKTLLSCLLIAPILLSAQTNFEGVITYKGISTNEINNFEIKVFYSDLKMKVKVFSQRPMGAITEIYNFKTGIHYSVFDEEKMYSVDSLNGFSLDETIPELKDTTLNECILGYNCKSFTVTTKEENPFADKLFDESSTVIWYPESIKFIIPEKYRNATEIGHSADGNTLFLKMQTIVDFTFDDDDEIIEGKSDTFLLIADKIEIIEIDELEFQPPAGYTYSDPPALNYRSRDPVVVKELTLTELKQEEELKPEPPPPPPPKVPKSSKSSAKKGKESKPGKGKTF